MRRYAGRIGLAATVIFGGVAGPLFGQAAAYPERPQPLPEAEEIALAILYLASDESLFVTGSNLVIDHGDTA